MPSSLQEEPLPAAHSCLEIFKSGLAPKHIPIKKVARNETNVTQNDLINHRLPWGETFHEVVLSSKLSRCENKTKTELISQS